MQVLVGDFNEQQLREGVDEAAVKKKMDDTGLRYTNTKLIKKKGETLLRIWVCATEEFVL